MALASNVLKIPTAMMASSAPGPKLASVVTANLARILVMIHPYSAAKPLINVLLVWKTPTAMTASSAMAQRLVTRARANAKVESHLLVAMVATS